MGATSDLVASTVRRIRTDGLRETGARLRRGAVSRLVGALERRGVLAPTPPTSAEEMVPHADRVWGPSPASLPGLNLRADRQLEMLENLRPFAAAAAGADPVLEAMQKVLRPERIIAVGAPTEAPGITSIPFDDADFGLLRPRDLLCVQGTDHVEALVLEVLPTVRSGVWIRFDPVLYPFVPRGRISLIRAFLAYNDAFQIRFWPSFLYQHYRSALAGVPAFCTDGPSLWVRKVG